MMRYPLAASLAALLLTCIPATWADTPAYPDTPRRAVTDTYHGTAVTESYRWLEDLGNPEVAGWVAQQNALTRSVVDKLPSRAGIAKELGELMGQLPTTRRDLRFAGGRLFALKHQPSANQPQLVMLPRSVDLAGEKLVLDPNSINRKGTTAIDWYVPSLDGKTVAVSLSDNGSEDGSLHFFDVATGQKLPDVLARVQYPTGGGSVAWAAGNRGVYYTRYPQGSERAAADANFYQQIWFHRLGTPATQDRYVAGDDFPRIAQIMLTSTADGRYTLADVSNGDGGPHAFYLRNPAGRWDRIAAFEDGVRQVVLGRDARWYALVLKGSPRGRIVAGSLLTPSLALTRPVVPQGELPIASLLPTERRIYVELLTGGPQELHAFTLSGRPLGRIGDAAVATIQIGIALRGDEILYTRQSFVEPSSWFRYKPSMRAPNPMPVMTALNDLHKVSGLDDIEVRREFVASKDGTRVPLNIVLKRGTVLDGRNPLLLSAYGGYGVSMQPWFSPLHEFWLRHGGIYVLANVRGGGEFGEDWHLAGKLTRKQNVFDDFLSCADYLLGKGYTAKDRLAIAGGSNGGLLMGAALVQRPDLFRAVVSHVGFYDMLRVELSPNGAFSVNELGSVKDAAQFAAMKAYSPYHNVVDSSHYPAVMLLTGINDGRVEAHQSLKMAARLQAAAPTGRPVLLRVADDAGHGQGMPLASLIEQEADVFAFLFDQLGMQ